jgi:hypothetical protein
MCEYVMQYPLATIRLFTFRKIVHHGNNLLEYCSAGITQHIPWQIIASFKIFISIQCHDMSIDSLFAWKMI